MTFLFAAMLSLWAASASAHNVGTSYVHLEALSNGSLTTRVDLSLRDLEFALGVDGNNDLRITWGEVSANLPAMTDLATHALNISRGKVACQLTNPRLAIETYANEPYATLSFATLCTDPGELAVQSNLFFDIDDSHRTLLSVNIDDQQIIAVLTHDTRSWTESSGSMTAFLHFVGQGVWHIWIGFDHLAFLCLLLLPLLRMQQPWQAMASQALRIVTAFTVAHSITLLCAALGYVSLPSRWIEAAIAASIVIAACANLLSAPARYGTAMAFGFGLIHGLGFASALAALVTDSATQRVAPLLAFNLGVEIGQLAIIALIVPVLLMRRYSQQARRRTMTAGSLVMGTMGFAWLLQRTLFN